MRPQVEALPSRNPGISVVMADVGLSSKRGINWLAPIIRSNGIQSLPYFLVLDAHGTTLLVGAAARHFLGYK